MTVFLVGNPNVGKSVLFNKLTGNYTTVSNYPGTTVELFKGKYNNIEIVDTPGIYSLLSLTEEERVTRNVILNSPNNLVVYVVDAKNLERSLPLFFQMIEAGLSLILCLNMMDEAKKEGLIFDVERLESELGVPVVVTTAITGEGISHLKRHILSFHGHSGLYFRYPDQIEKTIDKILPFLPEKIDALPKRFICLMLLKDDEFFKDRVKSLSSDKTWSSIISIISELKLEFKDPLRYIIGFSLQNLSNRICKECVKEKNKVGLRKVADLLNTMMLNPVTGFPILFLFLYLGLYKFVGRFGAGVLVDFLENSLFTKILNPFFKSLTEKFIPWIFLQNLFSGEYGILTLGLRYAVAIILPVITSFFFIFAIVEDSGYLPRLSLLVDRIFKKIGLSGRAVIPMVLGFGCVTMATLVTRTLPTKRERFIATLLLALAVPCSAQLGLIVALLSSKPVSLLIWAIVIFSIFMLTGILSNYVIPGNKPSFYMELPPLRIPKISNVVLKTFARVKWYFFEVFPMFILISFLIWLGQITGVFDIVLKILKVPVNLLGLPDKTAVCFLFGFFRRDYGASGLYDLVKEGLLNSENLIVSAVTLTLFLPCVAQFLMNIKERGLKTGVFISFLVLFISFSVGFIIHLILSIRGINL